jgi:hypothetical protein
VAAKIANIKPGDFAGNQHTGRGPSIGGPQVSQAEAAKMLNVSERSVQRARAVQEASPELAAAVEKGEMSVSKAAHQVRARSAVALPDEPPPCPRRSGCSAPGRTGHHRP